MPLNGKCCNVKSLHLFIDCVDSCVFSALYSLFVVVAILILLAKINAMKSMQISFNIDLLGCHTMKLTVDISTVLFKEKNINVEIQFPNQALIRG